MQALITSSNFLLCSSINLLPYSNAREPILNNIDIYVETMGSFIVPLTLSNISNISGNNSEIFLALS